MTRQSHATCYQIHYLFARHVETILFLQDMIQDIYKLHWNIIDRSVAILKKQVTLKWRWKIDVDAGLVFILNIDTRSQFKEKRKVVRGEKRS